MAKQLPLPPFFARRTSFDQFWPGGNELAVSSARGLASGAIDPFLFLWGPGGSGKSHLLQAACQAAHQQGRLVSYLPLRELERTTGAFDGLEERHLVCIDDLECVLGEGPSERAVFRLCNELRDRRHGLMISAHAPPGELPVALPDLRSRLSWGMVFRLNPLNEADTASAIDLCAGELGLELPPQVKRFLLTHCSRDFDFLRRLLEDLDAAALAAQRRLTVPFVKRLLKERI